MKSLLRLFLLAILVLSGPFAKASLLSTIFYGSCGPCLVPTITSSTSVSGGAVAFSDVYGGASSQASYGTLKASVDSSYTSSPYTYSFGNSLAQFSDWITLGGLAGPQQVTFILHTDGTMGGVGEATTDTTASMSITLNVDGKQVALVADYFGGLPLAQPSAAQGGGLTGTFELDYGTQISLDALLQVSGNFGGFAHFGDTVTLEIIAPQGTTLTSGSGTNYRLTTVPEPATAALLLLGLALLATRDRYRRS